MRAKAIFVGGTASHAGKSWMATAICRYLKQQGLRVAPFKAQNMSNNSFPCAAGGEIGRAQVAQAEACELEPEPDMNPILLKPTSDKGSQIVLNGNVFANLTARDYYSHTDRMREAANSAYDRLAARFDYIVMEGAGSIAEMNLKERDVVNLSMAAYAGAKGLVVADIDRGGVFGSLCGTIDLLSCEERELLCAFAVNRFRGDASLFHDGVSFLEQRTKIPCLGVFPTDHTIQLHAEDGVSLDEVANSDAADVAVIRLPHISNFTDFRLLECQWISRPVTRTFSWVILPGTKNTLGDLEWLRRQGLADWVVDQRRNGAKVLGVCGGYQMLGEWIHDPHGVESPESRSAEGLGLLPVRTILETSKVTRAVAARTSSGVPFGAYEIHMGKTDRPDVAPFAYLDGDRPEGACMDGVYGTYLHGAFETPAVAREFFGVNIADQPAGIQYDQLAYWFKSSANLRLFQEQFL